MDFDSSDADWQTGTVNGIGFVCSQILAQLDHFRPLLLYTESFDRFFTFVGKASFS